MNKLLKFGGVLLLVLVVNTTSGMAQTDCPADRVCISREAALKALADADRVKALEVELSVLKDKAIPDLKSLLADMRVEFARCSGETTTWS